jgi:hypothetical protein
VRGEQAAQDAVVVAVGADAERDVGGPGEVMDLVSEDAAHALAGREPGHGRDVRGERDGGQRSLADDHRMDKLHRHMQGVRARRAGAEHHQFAALMESPGHGVTGHRHCSRVLGKILYRRGPAAEQPGDVVVSDGWPHYFGHFLSEVSS